MRIKDRSIVLIMLSSSDIVRYGNLLNLMKFIQRRSSNNENERNNKYITSLSIILTQHAYYLPNSTVDTFDLVCRREVHVHVVEVHRDDIRRVINVHVDLVMKVLHLRATFL